ncbi:MAG: response regulator transcription factor [Gammaproteobacteria bacterium]
MKTVRILIADDHELIRKGIASTLAEVPGWTVVAQAENGRQAVELAQSLRPDIVILDMTMPELNGLEATRQILSNRTGERVLILTAHESEQLVREVLNAGAQGYVLKSDAGRALVSAVEALLDGRPFFTSKVARIVLDGFLRSPDGAANCDPAQTLSPREREIVQLLAEGKSNKEVARALGITVKTAETHRGNIMRKMEFASLSDLIRYAIRNNIVGA